MTTSGTTTTTKIILPNNLRVAHIVVSAPPTAVPAGGFAVPLPAGFRSIKFASMMQTGGLTTGIVWHFNPATQKAQAFVSNGASPALLNEFTGDASTRPFEMIVWDWDETDPVTVAGA